MQPFVVPYLDPVAEIRRREMRRSRPKDLADKTMRLALHLSDAEHYALEAANPETLGRHDDERLRSQYWAQFIANPASEPFRVNKV